MILFFKILLAYIIGAFPSGLVVAKFYGQDVKKSGSGNIGATNLARVLGKKAGLITLILDLFKGWLACQIDPTNIGLLGLFAVLGHCFSFPKLKGGKGVASSLGVLLALNIKIAIIAILIFALSFSISRIVSIASIISALGIIITLSIFDYDFASKLSISLISILIIIRHHENIERIFTGIEKKFSFGSR